MEKDRKRERTAGAGIALAVAAIVAALCALAMEGCAHEEANGASSPASCAFVVGAHANAPLPKVDCAVEYLAAAVDSNGYVEVISAEGNPRSAVPGAIVGSTARTASKRSQENEQWRAALPAYLAEVRAQTPQVDTLAAVGLAARALSEAPGEHRIVVMDSGLSTTGALDFTQGALIDADADEVASWLVEHGEVPDLAGVALDWYYLGDVAAPQRQIPSAQIDNLRAIWRAVLERAGATVTFHDALPGTEVAEGLPEVDAIEMPERIALPESLRGGEVVQVEFKESDIRFLGDSDAFVDEAHARDAVASCITLMKERGATCLVEGVTASADPAQGEAGKEFVFELSRRRADAVAELFLEAGVDPAAIETRGCGDEYASCVPDRDEEGRLIPSAAAENRKVVITLYAA